MSGFTESNFLQLTKIHNNIKKFPPRGGSSIVEVQGKIIVFGGADREQCHFQDMVVYKPVPPNTKSTPFEILTAEGDVPTPRSGHSTVAYGKYLLLFGGIDFAEEVAYNDLYILDTENWVWNYVGEAGVEVVGRNSHSMSVLTSGQQNILVLFGGASPEHGPLNDTIYAALPPCDSIEMEKVFVEWKLLDISAPAPSAREMHSTSSILNFMMVLGGRDINGNFLSDTWILSLDAPSELSSINLSWRKSDYLSLSIPRCSHTSAITVSLSKLSPEKTNLRIALFGGFTPNGISTDISIKNFDKSHLFVSETQDIDPWISIPSIPTIPERFGHTMCTISSNVIKNLLKNTIYKPIFLSSSLPDKLSNLSNYIEANKETIDDIQKKAYRKNAGILIFGGVNIESDFGDIWLLTL